MTDVPLGWLDSTQAVPRVVVRGNQPGPKAWLYPRYIPAAEGPDPAVLGNFPPIADAPQVYREIDSDDIEDGLSDMRAIRFWRPARDDIYAWARDHVYAWIIIALMIVAIVLDRVM